MGINGNEAYVYLFASPKSPYVKIGSTNNLTRREYEIKNYWSPGGCSLTGRIVAYVTLPSRDEAYFLETCIHRYFVWHLKMRPERHTRDWFFIPKSPISTFKSVLKILYEPEEEGQCKSPNATAHASNSTK